MKLILGIYTAADPHWIGDGFPVRTIFSYQSLGRHLSPFLMLDYVGPTDFMPSERLSGFGRKAHRGLEKVTIVYQGELEHRDSAGAGGHLGSGDVQWMTAGRGILHEEFHSGAFTRRGGALELVQLWVNLPGARKMTSPSYQTILNSEIPVISLPSSAGILRLIAGNFNKNYGPATTFTDLDVWDLRLNIDTRTTVPLKCGRNAAIVILHGAVLLGKTSVVRAGQWALASADGNELLVQAISDSVVLVLGGDPIDEPIVGYGPFVMNNEEEIRQAMLDVRNGTFGQLRRPD